MEIGRLGPANRNPLPEVVACEIVKLYLLELVTEMGMIRLLPTATVPKLVVDTDTNFSVAAAPEIVKRERKRPAYTSLRGDPRRLIFTRSLCCACSAQRGIDGAFGLCRA